MLAGGPLYDLVNWRHFCRNSVQTWAEDVDVDLTGGLCVCVSIMISRRLLFADKSNRK